MAQNMDEGDTVVVSTPLAMSYYGPRSRFEGAGDALWQLDESSAR